MIKTTMRTPVRCRHCGEIYDLGAVESVARYADCTVFRTPCCDRLVDDRSEVSLPEFSRVAENSGMVYLSGGRVAVIDSYGRMQAPR